MPYFRLYHLDRHTGHIGSAEDLYAADDVAAIHQVQLQGFGHPVEIWQGGRKVVHIDAAPEMVSRDPI